MYGAMKQHLANQIDEIRKAGLFKSRARALHGPEATRGRWRRR